MTTIVETLHKTLRFLLLPFCFLVDIRFIDIKANEIFFIYTEDAGGCTLEYPEATLWYNVILSASLLIGHTDLYER